MTTSSNFLDGPLSQAFARYRQRWPNECAKVSHFERLFDEAKVGVSAPFLRTRMHGHFTGSAWLVSTDGECVLLTHHRKLGRWLQLGGHADGDSDLARVALREAEEESGLGDLVVEPDIFDLDRHWIPERNDEPGHWHYDVRYVVRTTGNEQFAVSDESHALAWRNIAELATDPGADESLQRMALRWLAGRHGDSS